MHNIFYQLNLKKKEEKYQQEIISVTFESRSKQLKKRFEKPTKKQKIDYWETGKVCIELSWVDKKKKEILISVVITSGVECKVTLSQLREIRYVYQRINRRFGIKAKGKFHFTIILFFQFIIAVSFIEHKYLFGNIKAKNAERTKYIVNLSAVCVCVCCVWVYE